MYIQVASLKLIQASLAETFSLEAPYSPFYRRYRSIEDNIYNGSFLLSFVEKPFLLQKYFARSSATGQIVAHGSPRNMSQAPLSGRRAF